MPKGTALWVSIAALVVAVIAILVATKVVTLPWVWG